MGGKSLLFVCLTFTLTFANVIPPRNPTDEDCWVWDEFCSTAQDGTLKPNPKDCRTFCECAPEGPVKMECPDGLHFSVTTNECEEPLNAGCEHRSKDLIPAHHHHHAGDCSAVVADCKASPVGTLLRNPSDCGSFCQCAAWGPVKMDCPAGLHFSVTSNRCEQPSVAGCIPSPPTSMPHHHGCHLVEHMCPKNNIGNVRLLRNPLDCNSYCACDWGKAFWMPCPGGLHFNRWLQVCDWPANAGC